MVSWRLAGENSEPKGNAHRRMRQRRTTERKLLMKWRRTRTRCHLAAFVCVCNSTTPSPYAVSTRPSPTLHPLICSALLCSWLAARPQHPTVPRCVRKQRPSDASALGTRHWWHAKSRQGQQQAEQLAPRRRRPSMYTSTSVIYVIHTYILVQA